MNDFLLNLVIWLALLSAAWNGFNPSMVTELFLWTALCKIMFDRYDRRRYDRANGAKKK